MTGNETQLAMCAACVAISVRVVRPMSGWPRTEAAVPAPDAKVPAAAAALDEAFGKALTELVVWVAGII